MWQEILTGIILAAAVFYLIKRFLLHSDNSSGCGSCPSNEIIKKPVKKA